MVFEIKDRNRFALDPDFLRSYEGRQPEWGFNGLGYIVFKRTYARDLPDGRTEEFWQTLSRVIGGAFSVLAQHLENNNRNFSPERAQRKAQEMFQRAWDFKWLPPGRGLWVMGSPIIEAKGCVAANNCAFHSTKNIDQEFSYPFCTTMDFLMLGAGVGFDTRGAGKVSITQPRMSDEAFVVEDSREGWIEALCVTLEAYVGRGLLPNGYDVSRVRPRGAPLKTFGGTSSGPGPLIEMLASVRAILDENKGYAIKSTTIVDLMNVIGRCVVAGNIRRSSQIALGDASDQAFVSLKSPQDLADLEAAEENFRSRLEEASFLSVEEARIKTSLDHVRSMIRKHPVNQWRWASNNSLFVGPDVKFKGLAKQTAINGEPGYLWLDNIRKYGRLCDPPTWDDMAVDGTNPCGEISLEDGEMCNVVENFPARHEDICDFKRTLKMSYLYGKIVSLIPAHNARTGAVMAKNRRIGNSLAGVFAWYEKVGRREAVRWMDEGYRMIRELDTEYSEWMGVARSIKRTTVKPGGSTPILASQEGGMRVAQSKYYMRTVRMLEDSPLVKACERSGYRVEKDRVTPNTSVVYFPCRSDGGEDARTLKDVSLWEQASIFTDLQTYWSDNQVSATLMVKPHEKNQIERVLEHYADRWKSVSFLPEQDHGYEQAPYIECTEEEYNEAAGKLSPINLTISVHDTDEKYCDGDRCVIPSKDG